MNQLSSYRQQVNLVYKDAGTRRGVFACLCLYEGDVLIKIISVKFLGFVDAPKNIDGKPEIFALCGECLEQDFEEVPGYNPEDFDIEFSPAFSFKLFARPPTFA